MKKQKPRTMKGIAASPGIAIGRAHLLGSEEVSIPKKPIRDSAIPKEITRFQDALTKTRAEIQGIRDKISQEMGQEHGDIFNAHLMVLEDRAIIEEVMERIKKEKFTAEYIFSQVLKKYVDSFSKIDDEYLRERVSDINDVGRRVIRHLLGDQRSTLSEIREKVIVVAYDLAPSDTAVMHRKNVIGFATDIGGRTSHTAIISACWAARIAIAPPCENAPRLPPTPIAASFRRLLDCCPRARELPKTYGVVSNAPAAAERVRNSRRVDLIAGLL